MFSGVAGAALLKVFAPIFEALFNSVGRSFNDWMASKRAEKNAHDLGAAEANLGTARATIDAQQAELQAQADAPTTVDEALKRLEDGSA
jgi:hypothetical protein